MTVHGKRLKLFSNSETPLPSLAANRTLEIPTAFNVTTGGTHSLVCSLTYFLSALGDSKTLRHSFKFESENAFAIRQRVAPLSAGRRLVETAIRNTTRGPILLSDATLLCSPGLEATRIDPPETEATRGLEDICYLHPGDARGLVFSVTGAEAALRVRELGHLKLLWVSQHGGTGESSDTVVMNAPCPEGGIAIRTKSSPTSVEVHVPFQIVFAVSSHSDSALDGLVLAVDFDRLHPLAVADGALVPIRIPTIPPRGETEVSLPLVSGSAGAFAVEGVAVEGLGCKWYPSVEGITVVCF
eukprot:Polyplicarium_translucidae@DN1630_c0_g1_i2.p1